MKYQFIDIENVYGIIAIEAYSNDVLALERAHEIAREFKINCERVIFESLPLMIDDMISDDYADLVDLLRDNFDHAESLPGDGLSELLIDNYNWLDEQSAARVASCYTRKIWAVERDEMLDYLRRYDNHLGLDDDKLRKEIINHFYIDERRARAVVNQYIKMWYDISPMQK